MTKHEQLRNAHLLLFANKQDKPGARSPSDIEENLRVAEISGFSDCHRSFRIQPCSAITGDGLVEGMEWLTRILNEKKH